MIRWAAIILASLSWIFAFHHHVAEDPVRQWALIAGAVMLGALGLQGYAGRVDVSRRLLLVLIPLVLALVFAFPAYRPALYVLAVGVCLLSLPSRAGGWGVLQPVGLSALVVGIVLVLQSASYWACTAWTARNPEIPYLGALLHPLLRWVGVDASYSGGRLYVRMMRTVHEFPLLWEHVAIFPLLQVWLAGALVTWLNRARRPFTTALATLTGTLIGYSILRLFLLIPLFVTAMLFVDHDADVVHVELFWLPWITALSFLPLIPIVSRFLPWPAQEPGFAAAGSMWDQARRRATILAVACAGSVAAAFAVHFWDPGTAKAGRILLDEAHSQWERTDHPYTTDWYGHESGYNYYCMARYLDHFYDLDFNMADELTAKKLANYDVLILKTPTESYTDEEIEAIEGFVRAGGGLFALGEHTNVFGSSVALNPVTRRFGIAFRYDSVFDLTRKWEQVHFPSALKRNPLVRAKLGRHPIMQDVPFYRFAVSCSIATDSWKVRPVIRSTGLWALPIEYAAGNFYPHVEDTTYARFGAFNQIVSTTAGKGRVVAFGDSTVYSNFLAFYPGKPELLLGTVQWLNRTNRLSWVNSAALVLSVVSLVVVVAGCRRLQPRAGFCAAVVSVCAASVWMGMWVCAALAERSYAAPEAHTPVHEVVFAMGPSVAPAKEVGLTEKLKREARRQLTVLGEPKTQQKAGDDEWPNTYELPLFAFTQRYAKSFEIFYQWVLRLGYYTKTSFDLDGALAGPGPIVVIEPVAPFSATTRAKVRAFLERGGSLAVLDSPRNEASTANALLEPFGLSFGAAARGSGIVVPGDQVRVCSGFILGTVDGGTPLLVTSSGEPVLSFAKVGKGQVAAGGLAERFNDAKMGGSSRSVPNAEIRAVYELEFALIRGLVQGNLHDEIQALGATYGPPATK